MAGMGVVAPWCVWMWWIALSLNWRPVTKILTRYIRPIPSQFVSTPLPCAHPSTEVAYPRPLQMYPLSNKGCCHPSLPSPFQVFKLVDTLYGQSSVALSHDGSFFLSASLDRIDRRMTFWDLKPGPSSLLPW